MWYCSFGALPPNEMSKGKHHGHTYKESLEETLKPLERLDPDPQLPSRLPPIIEPQLEARRWRSCVVLPQPLALPRTPAAAAVVGDARRARRAVVDGRAATGPFYAAQRRVGHILRRRALSAYKRRL